MVNQNLGQPGIPPEQKQTSSSKKPDTAPVPKRGVAVPRTITGYRLEKEEEETKKQARVLGFSYVNLFGFPISAEVLNLIPLEVAEKTRIIPYLKIGTILRVAAENPGDEAVKQEVLVLEKKLKLKMNLILASKSSIDYGLDLYRSRPKSFAKRAGEEPTVTEEEERVFREGIKSLKDIKEKIERVTTTKMLELILAGAAATEASDIHLTPLKEEARLRYRIDGVLHDGAMIDQNKYKALNSRIKFLAKMKMDISNLPQDGRFSIEVENRGVDLRVSTLPSLHGESIVMRLLEQEKEVVTLDKLGFNRQVLDLILSSIKKTSGLILNTGPTGSGKTTTLYAILQKINKSGVKIITLEDPVEYKIKGVNQTQIDPSHEFGFAKALRAALRQDPDIIMIGEIRDAETATIALHAALTGHLVLTTLHTNNAPAALTRLVDMRIRPFLLVGSVNLTIAQRLVRKICPNCKTAHKLTEVEKGILKETGMEEKNILKLKFFEGKGCEKCNLTGYKGRTAIIEAFTPDKEIEKLILAEATQKEMMDMARKKGMKTMFEDGIDKVVAGLTTISEILRVTSEFET